MAPALRSADSSRTAAGGSTLERVESVVLFVPDVDAAAAWYAALFGTTVQHENPHYAFVRGPGVLTDLEAGEVDGLSSCRRQVPGRHRRHQRVLGGR